ncbi:MAG TPA: tRNA lysidine(34) synthetase TilS [Verrucomicrobiae bacterium]|jgi:tRNA(Ile)-lysidine synthase|nr:tRNA lysidine(34) synthetase TilS [Verrucomicrobiae bacterium]
MKKLQTDFQIRFQQHLKLRKLILPGEKVYIACSGGPDSTALFHLLCALREKGGLKLGLLHVNHGLRREALRDEKFVRALGRKYKVPVLVKRVNVKALARRERLSLEEAARQARHAFFREAGRRGVSKIALAHTRDDQAETVLMRLIQGTGLRGLAGVRESMDLGKVRLVRPLLDFSKPEILGYLKENKFAYVRDKTNRSTKFLRNKIRHKLLPFLEKEFHPGIRAVLARVPRTLEREQEILSRLEEKAYGKIVAQVRGAKAHLRRVPFLGLPEALQFRVLDRVLKQLDGRSGLSFENWEGLKPHLERPSYRHSLQKDIDFALTPRHITLFKKNPRS